MDPIGLVERPDAAYALEQKGNQCDLVGPCELVVHRLKLFAVGSPVVGRNPHPEQDQSGRGLQLPGTVQDGLDVRPQ